MERRGFTERKLKEISENLDIRKRGDDRDVAGLNQRRRGEFVALQWYRLDRNVPHVLSNLFAGQQKPNRFRRDDAGKPALVLYWSTGGKLCDDHCQFRFFLHKRSRFPQMGCGAKILKRQGFGVRGLTWPSLLGALSPPISTCRVRRRWLAHGFPYRSNQDVVFLPSAIGGVKVAYEEYGKRR